MERNYFKNLTEEERRQLKQNIFQKLDLPDTENETAPSSRQMFWKIAVAASIILATGLLVFRANDRNPQQKLLLAATAAGEVKQIMLQDSSVVILNPDSKLFMNSGSKNAREVYLEGNGFFKVKHLASRKQFVVHANSLNVTVLGTEFNVNARTPQVEVALTSGSVKVNREKDKHAEFIRPGEKITATNDAFSRSAIDVSMYSAWTKGEWIFRNTSLSEIARLIHEYYSVDVVFTKEQSSELKMTAVIPVTSIQGLIRVINETLPVDLTLNNQQLYIQ